MNQQPMTSLLALLRRMREAGIAAELSQTRDSAVSVLVAVPGERWEIDFHEDGTVDVERFSSDGTILGEDALEALFSKHSE